MVVTMSGLEPAETVKTAQGLKRKRLPSDQHEDLDGLDDIFRRIKAAVPRAPYILSTPSLNPYRYHSQQEANAWMMGRLWRHDEEHKQYRTFLYREPCQDCFELQAGEDDEPEMEATKSQTSNKGTKKKMNLSAFKVKQVNGSVASTPKKDSPDASPKKRASDHPHAAKMPDKFSTSKQSKGSKSPAPSSTNARDERKAQKANHANSRSEPQNAPPSSSQKGESAQSKDDASRPNSPSGTPHGLPPLLSPVDGPLGNPHGLPNILSPTLPSNIQAELDRLESQRKRAESNASTSSSDRKSQSLAVTKAQSKNLASAPKTESQTQFEPAKGKSPNPPSSSQVEEKSPSLIVKLKFSKAKIPTVKSILRLPPKRSTVAKKDRQGTSKDVSPERQTKPIDRPAIKKKAIPKVAARRPPDESAQVSTPTSTPNTKPAALPSKVPEKRPRREDDGASAVPAKRPKTSALDRPITPVQHNTSPSVSAESSAQKGQLYLTPKKDLKASNMLRTQSAESYNSTPGRSGSTPAGVRAEKAAPTSTPLNNKKQVDISLLAQTSMKLNQMGRALKHEATKILTTAGKKLTKQDEKQAAVINLECILSYMAAYYAQDLSLSLRGRAGEVEHTWKTLLPLCLSYARSTKEFRHLDGLRSYLGAVIASAICTHVSQRTSTSRPHDSPQDVAHAELAKQHTSLVENFALLSDHTMKMHRHFTDARIALPMEDLQSMYKKTWAAREPEAKLIREPEKVSGARMSGPYFLPLSVDTTPIQAVRFGLKFLSEYCEKEKLNYNQRVSLDKPE